MEATHREETRWLLAFAFIQPASLWNTYFQIAPFLSYLLGWILGRYLWQGAEGRWVGEKFSELKEVPEWLTRVGLTSTSFLLCPVGWLINVSGQLVPSKNVEAWGQRWRLFCSNCALVKCLRCRGEAKVGLLQFLGYPLTPKRRIYISIGFTSLVGD